MGTVFVQTQLLGGDTQVAAEPPSGSARRARNPEPGAEGRRGSAWRELPDPTLCQARSTALARYVDCLVPEPFECQYALCFGYGFFCLHPRGTEISQRTAAERRGTFQGEVWG